MSKRFEVGDTCGVFDLESNDHEYCLNDIEVCDLLNNQAKQITDLEAKLAESEERINWLVEAEFNRKWAKKYVEMRRKEDPMLCLPDSDEVYERYFELKQQLADTEAQNKRVLEKLDLIVGSNQELEQKLEEKKIRIDELESQFAYECECNKQFVECQNENEMLKQQLAETKQELERIREINFYNKDLADTTLKQLIDKENELIGRKKIMRFKI